jgi:ammonia channel protein AmtB
VDSKYISKQKSESAKMNSAFDYSTQFANPLTRYDLFIVGRGIIAGCVMVSAPAVNYKLWISVIAGAFGGLVQVGTSIILKKFKVDEPLQVFQTHGVPALLSLILIVCFDSSTGIFFSDLTEFGSQQNLLKIIEIFGANVLGCLIVIGWSAIFTIPFLAIIKKCCLRGSKVSELIGLDID